MKKNYELVEVKVISLANEDVITASGGVTPPSKHLANSGDLFGGGFGLGDLGTQQFN